MPMELDYGTRPLSIVHKSREWHGAQSHAGPSSATTTASTLLSRRRSTVVHVPPPGPPPAQPIPHLPPTPSLHTELYDGLPSSAIPSDATSFLPTDEDVPPQQYTRPSASANLAAVAAFSQSRIVNFSPATTASSSTDNLSDPPPPSMLRTGAASPTQTQDIVPDRLLLSPSQPRSATERSERRPSSRSALTRALELARQAVQLDSTNDDPYGAVLAYGRSVALLSEVMERVMRGEDSTETGRRRNGRRRSVVAQEEEVRRLKAIHDTYADRMNILSLIYSIPLPEHSPPSTYTSSSVSTSSTSTQPSSPSSTSPTSEVSNDTRSRTSSTSSRDSASDLRGSSETQRLPADQSDGMLAIGTAMFSMDTSMSPRTPVGPSMHPYATPPPASRTSNVTPPRQAGRPRASSTLPPPAPPPTTMPPPAPASLAHQADPAGSPSLGTRLDVPVQVRQRGHSLSHKRAGSNGKLASLQEESERLDEQPGLRRQTPTEPSESSERPQSRANRKRDSHPLPPLPAPSPTAFDAATPRNRASGEFVPPSPSSPSHFARPRGDSTLSTRSEMLPASAQMSLINTSTTMGTIFQRRNKTSAPPSSSVPTSGTASPTESTSSGSIPSMSKLTASSLPASTANSLGMSRTRASSQPGRRPAAASSSYPLAPSSATLVSQTSTRKVSVPSKLGPNAPQITINTALLSPPLPSSSVSTPLVPPPPIPHANIPNAPLSPLPPQAPSDVIRKPYHMMNLLRQTMSSKTGGYITRRLHVPQEVWSQGGAKLTNIPEKIRVVEVLCSALEELQTWSAEYFGAGNVSIGMAMGIGSVGVKEGENWATKLEEFSSVCDGVVGNFGKKLGVGEGFVTKKSSGMTSWGGKLTRQIDKFTNGKNLDSPAIYVQGLSRLFAQAQILDEHTKAMLQSPVAPLYASFPVHLRAALELKLKHASEFFAKVVLTFVIRDMALLLDKYVKKCEKWLAE
ncbi:hypothetical protein EIP91_012272 [Steccherinum ochraceum]|uniref:MIT domain-containing protein n=1 Tax=Steccherinum ochraceum TaxID=92696 RepID=A0A4R0RUS4_9APHY|nr:hypothetical protein EIP91_012272 [Steccherinum ochraceum]